MAKDFKALLEKYHFTDEHGHALENCVDYQGLLEAAADKPRFKMVSDDDGHRYVVPVEKVEEFGRWVEAGPYWEGWQGEDFNDYAIGGAPSLVTFESPRTDG